MQNPVNVVLLVVVIMAAVILLAILHSPRAEENIGILLRARAAAQTAARAAWLRVYCESVDEQQSERKPWL